MRICWLWSKCSSRRIPLLSLPDDCAVLRRLLLQVIENKRKINANERNFATEDLDFFVYRRGDLSLMELEPSRFGCRRANRWAV